MILDRHTKSFGKERDHGDQGHIATADQLTACDGNCSNRKVHRNSAVYRSTHLCCHNRNECLVSPPGPYTEAFGVDGRVSVETTEHKESLLNANQMLKEFEVAASRLEIRRDHKIKFCSPEDVPTRLAEEARLKDLSLIPIKSYDGAIEKTLEALIFESGRPVLIFPEELSGDLAAKFDHVSIAWDNSPQAARAVADALPLLQSAKTIRVLTATDSGTAAELESGAALARHLAEHGVKAIFETAKIDGSSVGKVFEAYVKANRIDLLVMGACRHSRLQEFIWGGATYTMLGRPPCWVMVSN